MATEAAEPKGSKKKMIIIGAVVALVAAAAIWFFLLKPSGQAEAEAKPEPGEVLTLEPIHVNLAGGGYLKIGLALQMTAEAGGHGTPNGAQALDIAIDRLSQADIAEVTGNRAKIKEDLTHSISEAYHGDVMAVYFTEFVTQ